MAKTKLTENREGKTPLELAVMDLASTEAGLMFFRHLCDELGFLRSSILQNAQTKEVITDVAIGMEANRKVWLKLRQLIPDERLFLIEIKDRKKTIELVDKTKGKYEKWATTELLPTHQQWDNRILEES